MTTDAILALATAGLLAFVDWWAVGTQRRYVEAWAKPGVLVALLVAAATMDPADRVVWGLVLVGLAFGLAGDVLLFLDRFVPGAAAFLVGHLAYTAAFGLAATTWLWPALGLPAAVGLGWAVGRPVVRGAAAKSRRLGTVVAVYLGVLLLMALTGLATGVWWVMGGALLFVASDALLGWTRFVDRSTPANRVVVHATYQLAQGMFVVALPVLAVAVP